MVSEARGHGGDEPDVRGTAMFGNHGHDVSAPLGRSGDASVLCRLETLVPSKVLRRAHAELAKRPTVGPCGRAGAETFGGKFGFLARVNVGRLAATSGSADGVGNDLRCLCSGLRAITCPNAGPLLHLFVDYGGRVAT